MAGRSDIDTAMQVALDRATLADHGLRTPAPFLGSAVGRQPIPAQRLDIETAMLVALGRAMGADTALPTAEHSDLSEAGAADPRSQR